MALDDPLMEDDLREALKRGDNTEKGHADGRRLIRVSSVFHPWRPTDNRIPVKHEGMPEVNQMLLKHFGLSNLEQLLRVLGDDFRYVEPVYCGPEL